MSASKARHACGACRRLKRRCDRDLPACSLCARLGKPCEYSGAPTNPSPVIRPSVVSQDPFLCLRRPIRPFPPRYFLDAKFFTSVRHSNALDSDSQPALEKTALENIPPADREAIFEAYFSSMHTWLPMISRKRLVRTVVTEPETCQDLLLLCMKLCATNWKDSLPAENRLYHLVRSVCSAAETAGLVSLRLVQSLTLITVYEFAHAIYPAAYLTIGRAARMAMLVGWHDTNAPQLFRPAESLGLREEQRRTWWAIFILDRVINAETNGLPFAAPEPSRDEFLPVNDVDFSKGRMAPSESLYTPSFSSTTTLGSFARTCQAAHMLSKVIQHKKVKMKGSQDAATLLEECQGLHQALSALQVSLEQPGKGGYSTAGENPPLAALAICVTAQLMLYNIYACRGYPGTVVQEHMASATEMQVLSVRAIQSIVSATVPSLAQTQTECPLAARCYYQASKLCAYALREDHEPLTEFILGQYVSSLERLGQRWRVAVELIDLLEQDGDLKFLTVRSHSAPSSYSPESGQE